ncbi:MAG: GxxExxY protein [Pirellula sp.]|jgi:GxxExxY protein
MAEILFKEESYKIVGSFFEVYNEMGCGFLEAVYQESLQIEFELQRIPNAAQKQLQLHYKGKKLESVYIPDFICFDSIIVEIKAVKELTNEHRAQVFNYLKATGFRLGLLVNFGEHPNLQYERIAC